MPACGYGTALRDFTAVIDHAARNFVLSAVQSIECGALSEVLRHNEGRNRYEESKVPHRLQVVAPALGFPYW